MKKEKEVYIICTAILLVSSLLLMILTPSMTGSAVKFRYDPPEKLTRPEALNALIRAEEEIKEMKTYGLNTYFLEDSLLTAKQAYVGSNVELVREEYDTEEQNKKKKDYLLTLLYQQNVRSDKRTNLTHVFATTQMISFRKKESLGLMDEMSLMEEKMSEHESEGMEMTEAKAMMEKAHVALKEERYDEAKSYLTETEEKMGTTSAEFARVKKLVSLSKGFLEKNWLPLLTAFFAASILALIMFNEIKTSKTKNEIEALKLERETAKKLMKHAQEDRFVKGTISDSIYKIRMEKYQEKLADIDRTIPVLEATLKKEKEEEKKTARKGIINIEP